MKKEDVYLILFGLILMFAIFNVFGAAKPDICKCGVACECADPTSKSK